MAHVSSDAWRTTGPSWLQHDLTACLGADLPGFFLGLPGACCVGDRQTLLQWVTAPLERQTFATVFLHANLRRAAELRAAFPRAVIVGSWYGDIRVPADGVTVPWDLDAVVAQLQTVTEPIFLCAGPCSNVIAHRYWLRQPVAQRVSVIDVGSAMDVLHGRESRHWHRKMHQHRCVWDKRGIPSLSPRQYVFAIAPRRRRGGTSTTIVQRGNRTCRRK